LRGAARDLCSGSGLTANRTNLLNASELHVAFNWVSRSPRPALCYRPLLAFPSHFAMFRVTQLEPRTPHQPENGPVVQPDVVSSAPPAAMHQLSPMFFPLAAPTSDLRLASAVRLRLDRGQPSGSDRCSIVRLDQWRTVDLHRLLALPIVRRRTLQLALAFSPPARPAITADSHLALSFSSARVQHSAFTVCHCNLRLAPFCCCGLQLALPAARLPYRRRLANSRRLFCPPALPVSIGSACALPFYLRLGL